MTTEIRVPTLGESVTEATVATWFKKPGDAVAADEMLCELETDKVTVEVPSPAAGKLAEIVAREGETVGVDALLAVLSEGEGTADAQGDEPAQLFFLETQSPNHCGSGGCTGTVYRKRGQSYIAITNFFGYFDRAIARSGNATPDIVYVHNESMRHDFTGDGAKDMAVIKVKYRWNAQRQNFEVADILAIEASGRKVDARAYREQLLQEYRQGSPWVY